MLKTRRVILKIAQIQLRRIAAARTERGPEGPVVSGETGFRAVALLAAGRAPPAGVYGVPGGAQVFRLFGPGDWKYSNYH